VLRVNKFFSNKQTARNDLPATHDNFCRKKDVKAVSSKIQYCRVASGS